ncbi:MAG TPA: hypothetical protein VI793_20385 [Anaerolineales bacterium]|nr:hypothetical protein [Anaerolineales bacterium]
MRDDDYDDEWEDEFDDEGDDEFEAEFDADDDPDDAPFNPIYAGFGKWAEDMDEEAWIEAACDKINEYGARAYLRRMLRELREAHAVDQVEVAATLSDDEMIQLVEAHLLGKRLSERRRFGNSAFLVFDDGHAMPVTPPGGGQTTPAELDAVVGKRLIGVKVEHDEAANRHLRLLFHTDPQAGDDWRAADTPRQAQRRYRKLSADPRFASLATDWYTGVMILCPDQDFGRRAGRLTLREADALAMLLGHLRKQRVADKLILPDGRLALIFDDEHILPLIAAPGQTPLGPADLEKVVGRFLVLAVPMGQGQAAYLSLLFHDNPDQADAMERAARDQEDQTAWVDAFLNDEATVNIPVALESADNLLCPGGHVDHPDETNGIDNSQASPS